MIWFGSMPEDPATRFRAFAFFWTCESSCHPERSRGIPASVERQASGSLDKLGMTGKAIALCLFSPVRTFHPRRYIPITVIRLVDLFHRRDGFLGLTHLLVDQPEIVNDLLLHSVH